MRTVNLEKFFHEEDMFPKYIDSWEERPYAFGEFCNANGIRNCYLWPDGDAAERIYREAGFRTIVRKQAGRAAV